MLIYMKSVPTQYYQKVWKRISPVKVSMIEKNEKCDHEIGDGFIYKYDRTNHKICGTVKCAGKESTIAKHLI